MKVPSHHSREQVSMADSTNMTRGLLTPNATVDKSKKMLSPGTRKKFGGATRTFNVPLMELVQRAPQGYKVPYIVKKICTYIEHHGLEHEGIFRVNGSQRVVEKMRASFDLHGDANFEEDHDVMAVAGLLKLFLRELPESCIPEHLTKKFVIVQEENQRNAKECVSQLKVLLKELPEEHYDLLKHVIRFLVIVSCNEGENKMSPMALAIVFGPNLFRCGKGFVALKDQGSTNQIVYRFIVEYNSLFKEATEDPPAVYWERKKHNLVPPRPPPPKFAPEEIEVNSKPTPVPRKSKLKGHDGFHVPEIEEPDHSESSISSKGRYSHSYSSPNFSDDEMTGRLSPFHLDSDSGFSLVESPVPSARTSEFVDKAIKATVIGHLFGDESSLLNASIDTTIREDQSEPAADLHVFSNSSQNDLNSTPVNAGVKDRMKMFETSNNQDNDALTKPVKQKPKSKAFEMFENKGIIITQVLLIFGYYVCLFKKPAGPPNRRSPSRRLRKNSMDMDEEFMDQQDDLEIIPNGTVKQNGVIDGPKSREHRTDVDVNQNDARARIAFLDIRQEPCLKKKIRQFEEAFEKEGKPSHAEKAAKPEIKKFMMELSRTRKEAKKLKEEAEMGSRSRHGSGASSTGERTDPPDFLLNDPSMSQTLDVILKKLKEKRKESQRPEDIELMKHEQVQDEKLAVQKALLHFEGIHGRPKSKDEKDLMRPLYDRYRTIKRLLSRQPMSPRGNLELQSVPEDKPIDIHSKFDEEHIFSENRQTMSIRVPTAVMENDEEDEHVAPLGTMEFAVTRDFSILKQRPLSVDDQGPHSPKARRKLELREDIENRNTTHSNLHELAVPELQDELIRSRNTKKRLRKTLRDFEEAFHRKTGRKVVRDDRIPMQTEYNEYKQIKARLKLLEALLSKHHHSDL
ncbi:protein FAM13A-like [Mercenaria mercenaria]|uniref:protein FAM13A-like n=1 Tax=Mercenaria mercenaria TaxID=6596 RepID=UPI00234E9552|nr:protein FAM13A-like [Mercenaria mercenaria]